MDREMLAEWLRDIAQHIEEESPLIRDVSVDDALSDEGLARKNHHVQCAWSRPTA